MRTKQSPKAQTRERLTFNLGDAATVPGHGLVNAAIAAGREASFATAVRAEPRDWGYFGLFAFTLVLLSRPQDLIPGLGVLHIAEVCAVVGILPMLVHRFARRQPVFRVTPETMGLVVFGFAILATTPFSVWPGGSLEVFTDMYLKVLVVFVLMLNTLTTPKRLEQITWLVLCCCGWIALQSVFNYVRGVHLIEGTRLAGPIGGIFGNPNDLAMNMVTFLPVATVYALSPRYSPMRRLTAAGIAALMLATIVFTQSRGGMLGLAAMGIALILFGQKIRPGFGATAIVAILLAAPFVPASYWSRMSSITDDQKDKTEFTGSREARSDLMTAGVQTFMERPLTGVGAGQFKNFNPSWKKVQWNETHNALLQVASELGVLGLVAFGFLIYRAGMAAAATRRMLSRPRKASQPDPLGLAMSDEDRRWLYQNTVAMSAGLVGWFVCSMFASVAYNWTFYYLLALIVAGRELTRDRLSAGRAAQKDVARSASVPSARLFPWMVPDRA
jgi:putative inorganic carbon (hco3(-)) transporter